MGSSAFSGLACRAACGVAAFGLDRRGRAVLGSHSSGWQFFSGPSGAPTASFGLILMCSLITFCKAILRLSISSMRDPFFPDILHLFVNFDLVLQRMVASHS